MNQSKINCYLRMCRWLRQHDSDFAFESAVLGTELKQMLQRYPYEELFYRVRMDRHFQPDLIPDDRRLFKFYYRLAEPPQPKRKTMSHPTQADFDDTTWETLCVAKLKYKLGIDKGTWWRVLRQHCGYRAGSRVAGEMGVLIDRFLLDHPSFVRHNLKRLRAAGWRPEGEAK